MLKVFVSNPFSPFCFVFYSRIVEVSKSTGPVHTRFNEPRINSIYDDSLA